MAKVCYAVDSGDTGNRQQHCPIPAPSDGDVAHCAGGLADCLCPEIHPAQYPAAGTVRQAVGARRSIAATSQGGITPVHRTAQPLYFLGSLDQLHSDRSQRTRHRRPAGAYLALFWVPAPIVCRSLDRKSTRLNSSHSQISYAVFCLKKKKNRN